MKNNSEYRKPAGMSHLSIIQYQLSILSFVRLLGPVESIDEAAVVELFAETIKLTMQISK
jgi:hypothetical protein